jgi:hypothetical protein
MNRAIGLPIKLASALNIGLTLTLTNGGADITLSTNHLSIPAGNYRFPDFVALVDDAIRRWMFARIPLSGGVNVGDKNSKSIVISLAELPGSNTALMTIQLLSPSCTIGGLAASFKAAGINRVENPAGHKWGTVLGLAFENDATVNFTGNTPAAGQLQIVGKFQSRYISVFDRSEKDSLTRIKIHYAKTHKLDSGKGRFFKFGGEHRERKITFVDQDYQMAMPDLTFGRIYQIQAARDLIDFRSPVLGGSSMDKLYFDTRFFRSGSYIEFEGFRTRAFYDAGTYGANTIKLADKVPTSIVSVAGRPVKLISDLWFCWKEAMALGGFQYFESDDYGDLAWIHDSYLPYGSTEPTIMSERRDDGIPLYDMEWNLIEIEDDELTVINIA